jgi:hypothetical protein
MPEHVKEFLLMPIADQLLSEMQDVCSSDCRRFLAPKRMTLTQVEDEVHDYWLRLEPDGIEEPAARAFARIELTTEPCNVGFAVDKEDGCPLFRLEPSAKNIDELLAIIKRVAAFRKAQAAEKRQAERNDPKRRAPL